MEKDLEKLIEDFIAERCGEALKGDAEYQEIISREHESEEELEAATRASYKRCFLDIMQLYFM